MSLDEAALIADVRSRLFAPSTSALTIGAELELIPIVAATRLPALIESQLPYIRRAANDGGWKEVTAETDPPSWNLPDGSRISFEPGGQIEISSRPHQSCSELVTSLQATVRLLAESAEKDGIELVTAGVDPYNDVSAVPLQLNSERYVRMTRYLEARGEFGIRMMRQTAAIQISVEHGPHPLERWALLNALVPYMLAIFANSSRHAGRETGHASYRAHFWRMLDESRTGISFDKAAPAERYAKFALSAGAIRAENGKGEFHSFRSILADTKLGTEDWSFHLSTLFPEIRPKEYFEIRSADTIAAEDLAAPLVFVAGLVYDESASRSALELLDEPSARFLEKAGRDGLRDETTKSRAADLVRLAIEGASRLPAGYLSAQHRERAATWLTQRVD
jgi:glutamate--cysteine ligase